MIIYLRKLKDTDINYFALWWCDKELIKLTSGNFEKLSDAEIEKYFQEMLNSKTDYHWMIELDRQTIGHINLSKCDNNWYETQIVIGEKDYWDQGYGTQAIKSMIYEVKKDKIDRIYLEVRPDNLRAIRAYKKSGFKKIKTIKYPDNPNLPETIRMEYSKI